MERFRVFPLDSEPLAKDIEPQEQSANSLSTPVCRNLKFESYHKGSCNKGTCTVKRFPDGTIILDDGVQRVVQRPPNHPERTLADKSSLIKRLRALFSDLLQMVFSHPAR